MITSSTSSEMIGLGMDNKLYTREDFGPLYSWVKFDDGPVTRIAVDAHGAIYGIGSNNLVYRRASINSRWAPVDMAGGEMMALTFKADGTILTIGMDHKLYTRVDFAPGSWWVMAPDDGGLVNSIDVDLQGVMYGIGMDHYLYKRLSLASGWVMADPNAGLLSIAFRPDGSVVGVGLDNRPYLAATATFPAQWQVTPDDGGRLLDIAVTTLGFISPYHKGTVVISDIHIGDNSRTAWYHKEFHDPFLTKILDWVIENKDSIKQFVILGDLFDLWTYLPGDQPPSVAAIIAANTEILGPGGKLSQVLTALNGNVVYLNGNHDISVTQTDLNQLTDGQHTVRLVEGMYQPGKGKVLYSHGHLACLFNAPFDFKTLAIPAQPWGSLPMGHFATRLIMYYLVNKVLKPGETALDYADQGSPYGISWGDVGMAALKSGFAALTIQLLGTGEIGLAKFFLDYLASRAGFSEDDPIILADGSKTTINKSIAYYTDLASLWVERYGLLYTVKSLWADYLGVYMGWFAGKMAMESGADLVVMGHTHRAVSGLQTVPGGGAALTDYVNTGFECPSKPDLTSNKHFSFALIKDWDEEPDDRAPEHRLYNVVQAGGSYTLHRSTAGPDFMTPPNPYLPDSTFHDYSTYVEITNHSNYVLVRTQADTDTDSNYVVEPPLQIGVGRTRRFWLQDLPASPTGTGGSVTYQAQGDPHGTLYQITYLCTFYPSLYDNQFSIQSNASTYSIQTRTGSAAGWTSNAVAAGNPLFARLIVTGS